MSTTDPPRTFPAAYFLHSDLTSPKALQSLLAAPQLLKVRKAWLPGHSIRPDGSVVASGSGFGGWDDQDEIHGVVLYVSCLEEEDRLRQHIGEVELKDVDLQVGMGGIWGTKEGTVGRAFVSKEVDKSVRNGVTEGSTIGGGHETYTLREALHTTDPSVKEPVENVAVDTPQLKTPKPRRMALLRRITEPLRLRTNVLENNFAQAGLATQKGEAPADTKGAAVQKDPRLARPSLLRRHTDFVPSKLSVVQDSHGQEDEASDGSSNVLPDKTTQKESSGDLESLAQAPLCKSPDFDEPATVPKVIIDEGDKGASPDCNSELMIVNTLGKEANIECEVEDHDLQERSTPVQDTSSPQASNATSVEPILDKESPDSEGISPSPSPIPLPLPDARNENATVDKHVDENTVVKRTSWNPWDLFQKLQIKPSHSNEENKAQQKEMIEEKVDEQKSPGGMRGLVAMYEMLKK